VSPLDNEVQQALQQPVTTVMTSCPFSVRPDTPIAEVLRLFSRPGVHQLIVTGTDGTVYGVITSRDIIAAITPGAGTLKSHHISGLDRLMKSFAAVASDLVSGEVLKIPDSATILEALRAMEHAYSSSLIVVNRDGTAVGCIDLASILALLNGAVQ
jgi:predicted transcriptional regulator